MFVERSGGHLHGDISTNTLIYLEEQEKGGLLHLDHPFRMPGCDFKFGFLSDYSCCERWKLMYVVLADAHDRGGYLIGITMRTRR